MVMNRLCWISVRKHRRAFLRSFVCLRAIDSFSFLYVLARPSICRFYFAPLTLYAIDDMIKTPERTLLIPTVFALLLILIPLHPAPYLTTWPSLLPWPVAAPSPTPSVLLSHPGGSFLHHGVLLPTPAAPSEAVATTTTSIEASTEESSQGAKAPPRRRGGPHRHHRRWPGSEAAAADPRRSESSDTAFPSHMLHIYVSSVLDVSDVCCICFIWILQM
jgi:hypothetical protein